MLQLGFGLSSFGSSYTHFRDAAQQLEALGFDSLWTWDHYVSLGPKEEAVLEGLSTLAAVAEATKRIKLGILVANNNNRHPARLAKIAATLQEISQGRFELGIGAGGFEGEQLPFGLEVAPAKERVDRLAEALPIIKGLWTGQPFSFTGDYYQLNEAICVPAPQPAPPLIVGVTGPRMARIAARYADGANLQWRHADKLPATLETLKTELNAQGRELSSFDLSLVVGWNDIAQDPQARVAEWQALGFTRAFVMIKAPFPLDQIKAVLSPLL